MLETYKSILNELLTVDKLSDIDYSTKQDLKLFTQINHTFHTLKMEEID